MATRIFLIIFLLLSVCGYSQAGNNSATVIVPVINPENVALESATVQLRRPKDSELIKTALTDNVGVAEFERVPAGKYFITVSMANYQDYSSLPFDVYESMIKLPAVKLQAIPSAQLQAVTVTGKKPFIQRMSDKTTLFEACSFVSLNCRLWRQKQQATIENANCSIAGGDKI